MGEEIIRCSFCNKSNREVKKLIAAKEVHICNECVDICYEIIKNELSTKCNCGVAEKLVKDPDIPIELDPILNQYYLVCKNDATFSIYFCPCCGGTLNEVKKTKQRLFQPIDPIELEEIHNIVKTARTIEQLVSILGQPDETIYPPPFPPKEKEIYNFKDIKRSLKFSSFAKSLAIIAQELEDDTLQLSYLPKQKLF